MFPPFGLIAAGLRRRCRSPGDEGRLERLTRSGKIVWFRSDVGGREPFEARLRDGPVPGPLPATVPVPEPAVEPPLAVWAAGWASASEEREKPVGRVGDVRRLRVPVP